MQNTYIRQVLSFLFASSMVFIFPFFAYADHTNAHTIEQLQQQITQLLAQITSLQQQLADQGGGGVSPVAVCPRFTYNFYLGMKDDETDGQITALQKILATDAEVYPEGLMTGYYGPLTEQAVRRYQKKYGIVSSGAPETTGYGVVGSKTRAKMREMCGTSVPPTEEVYISGVSGPTSLNVGQSGTWTVNARDPENGYLTYTVNWGDNEPIGSGVAEATQLIPAPQTATFTHSYAKQGIYTPVFYVTDNSGLSAKTSISVNVGSVTSIPSIQVISPNGGETWTKGTMQTIKWQNNTPILVCPSGAECMPLEAKYYDIKLVSYFPPCTGDICPMYVIAPYTIAKSIYGSSYNWSVGKIVNYDETGSIAPDGSYTVQVCQTGTSVCDSGDSYLKIVSGGTSTNNLPVINLFPAIPSDIKVGQSVSFSWGAVDADGDNLAWSVSWGEGIGMASACQSPNPQNKQNWIFNTSHAWTNPGTYTVKATVNDCRGGSAEHAFNVTVGSTVGVLPQGLDAFIAAQNGFSVKVNGGVSGAVGPLSWNWGDGSEETAYFPASHLYATDGSYTITVTAKNSGGAVSKKIAVDAYKNLTMSLFNPVVNAGNVSVNGVVQYMDGTISKITWNWGDGVPASEEAQWFPGSHTYAKSGTYNIRVTGWTADGKKIINTISVNIGDITKPSITVLSPNGGEVLSGGEVYQIKWDGKNFPNNSYVGIVLVDTNSINTYLFSDWNSSSTVNDGVENWTIPSSIPTGSYRIRIWCGIKNSERYCSSDGARNSSVEDFSDASFTITSASTNLSDLAVTDIYDDAGKLSVKISNIGTVPAPSNTGHLYIFIDDQLKWTYSLSTLSNQSFLSPGGVTVVQPQVLTGSHKIKATIDPNNAINELNENNNSLEKTATFLVAYL